MSMLIIVSMTLSIFAALPVTGNSADLHATGTYSDPTSDPFFGLPQSDPFFSINQANPFFSIGVAQPFFSVAGEINTAQGEVFSDPFFSVSNNADPFFSINQAAPYFGVPFFSIATEATPYFGVGTDGSPYFGVPFFSISETADPFFSVDASGNPYFAVGTEGSPYFGVPYFAVNDAGAPFFAIPFFGVDNTADPFFAVDLQSTPFFGVDFTSNPFFGVDASGNPFFAVPFFGVESADSLFVGQPFFGVDQAANPFFAIPFFGVDASGNPFFAIPFFGVVDGAPFFAIPFWGVDTQSNPFFGIPFFGIDESGSPFFGIPFFGIDEEGSPFFAIPFWAIDEEGSPFFGIPFFAIPNGNPFFGIPFWAIPFFGVPFFGIPFFGIDADFGGLPFFGIPNTDPFFGILEYAVPFFGIFKDLATMVDSNASTKNLRHALRDLYKDKDNRNIIKHFRKDLRKIQHTVRKALRHVDPEIQWNIGVVFDGSYVGDDYEDANIQVAVLDTGIDISHPDLGSVTWTYDATGTGFIDETGHGTHVTGIIAAEKNGFGVAGVYAGVEIYGIKVLSGSTMEGSWDEFVDGIYAAVRGPDGVVGTPDDADVISMSLDSNNELPPAYVHDAIQFAYDHGVALVAAAGNTGDGDATTMEGPTYPASYPEVISVGALDMYGNVATYSNTLASLEIMAPGHYIYSTFPDAQYVWWGGTSMAAPHVSGVVALLIAEYGSLPIGYFDDMGNYSLRGLLHMKAADFGTPGWDAAYGYGLVQF